MTEKQLQLLNFERYDEKSSKDPKEHFYYYTFNVDDYTMLITDADDEVKDDEWGFYMFEFENFYISDFEQAKKFIRLLKFGISEGKEKNNKVKL